PYFHQFAYLVLLSPFPFCLTAAPATEIYTLSLHDALPIWLTRDQAEALARDRNLPQARNHIMVTRKNGIELLPVADIRCFRADRSEEHTSELQSRENLVCRLLLEKKKKHINMSYSLFCVKQ